MTKFQDNNFIKEMREIIYQFSPSNPHRDGFIVDRKAQTNLGWYWCQLGQYMRDAEMEYNRYFLSILNSQEKKIKATAEVQAKTSVQYENFKRAKTLYETTSTLIHLVKREAEQLDKEVKYQT
jgi:hypothetical protein